jgi:exodeoxyribonuclease V beta subunit
MVNILDPLTFPLHGVRLIEASAGTGKTYTIAALYLRLILGHGGESGFFRALTPPEILVVTFTNAATEELRDRIRNRLTEAAAFFRGDGRGDDYLHALRSSYDAGQWLGCAQRLDHAAQWMDESAIYTIHAWCRQMIRQHAFDSGGLFDLDLTPRNRELLEEAACDYWRSRFYPQPKEIVSELLSICSTPQVLLKNIEPLIKEPLSDPIDPVVQIGKRLQAMDAARQAWASDFDRAIEQVRNAQADKRLSGKKYQNDSLAKWQEAMRVWIHENGPLPDEKTREKLSSSGLAAGVNKNKSAPQHPAYDAMERLNETLAALHIETALFDDAAADIGLRIQQAKDRTSQMDFDDLLIRLHRALNNSENGQLARIIRDQFPVAMIDEFQDTDPIQYAIFRTIYHKEGVPCTLLMIGDPKQSIYAFRGADIHTYLTARGDADGTPYTLGKNFRSTEGLVMAVNQVFGVGAGHPDGAFLFQDRIPYVEVAAEGRKDRLRIDGKPQAAMTFWRIQQESPINKSGDDGYINRMAESTASEIVFWLNLAESKPERTGFETLDGDFYPLRPADIAILVRNGSEARAVRQALYKRQVRSVYLSDKDSVFDTPEANSLFYLLRACAEPEQESLMRPALATDVLALSFNTLDRLVQDELAWEAEIDRFRKYRVLWRNQGVLPMLRLLFQEFGVPSRLLNVPGGERTLTNLLHLSEMLQAASAGLQGEQALIRWLAEQLEQPEPGVEDQILRLESDEELIRVITIHKSKGLEYPLVFLPFICSLRKVTAERNPVVKIHDENGDRRLVRNPGDEELAAADRERLAEDLRMLYVAMTRAKHACWLGIGVMGRDSRLELSALGYLLSAGVPIAPDRLAEKLAVLKGNCRHIEIDPLPEPRSMLYVPRTESPALGPALIFSGKIPSDWWIASYSKMVAGAHMAKPDAAAGAGIEPFPSAALPLLPVSLSPNSAKEDHLLEAISETVGPSPAVDTARSIHDFPRGPEPGSFLHDILEWAANEGFAGLASRRKDIFGRISDLCRRRDWADWDEILTSWLEKLIQTPIRLPKDFGEMTLAGLSQEDCRSEMEFWFAGHGVGARELDDAVTAAILPATPRPRLLDTSVNGMLNGFIDLVFCYRNRYYVLDYKSNHLGDSEAAYETKAMEKAILEHRYDLQYVIYILALHRLLKLRLPDYDYEKHVGGAVYLFLRGVDDQGHGVFLDRPSQTLIETLDMAFAGKDIRHADR